MPSDIEMKTFVGRSARDAADVNGIGLENGDIDLVLGKEIGWPSNRPDPRR